jgi:hypothetical protein
VTLKFWDVNGSPTSSVKTGPLGEFSITLNAGAYRVDGPDRVFVYTGRLEKRDPPQVIIRPGEHVTMDLGLEFEFQHGTICLASEDLISTPIGAVPIAQLRFGMTVWTEDTNGQRIAAPVLLLSHRVAPIGHQVVHVVLSDGRSVFASAGHPTADGRTVGELRLGDTLDGSVVISLDRTGYVGETWDLLPGGPSGVYWAGGILLSSTLKG